MPDKSDTPDWYEASASGPFVTFISHHAADKLNEQRRKEAEEEFMAWVQEVIASPFKV